MFLLQNPFDVVKLVFMPREGDRDLSLAERSASVVCMTSSIMSVTSSIMSVTSLVTSVTSLITSVTSSITSVTSHHVVYTGTTETSEHFELTSALPKITSAHCDLLNLDKIGPMISLQVYC